MEAKRRVFIAEDDEVVLESLRRLFLLSGFEVGAIKNPKEVIGAIKAFRPHVILLDLLMPEMGGFEICEALNREKETQGIPVFITSALAGEMDVKKAYRLGVVGYFTKPYDFKELLKEVNKAIAYKETK